MLRLKFADHGVPWSEVEEMDKVEVEKALVLMTVLDKQRFEMEKAATLGGICEALRGMKK